MKPLPGSRLIVRRRGYFHHGIYVGNDKVIHYAGWFHSAGGLVEEITVEQFADGRPYSIGRSPANRQRGEQIVRRARSRLGEQCYHLLSNNCEHFCNWCQLGTRRSEQVEAFTRPVRTLVQISVSMMLLVIGLIHIETSFAAPPANLAAAASLHAHPTINRFALRGDGAQYKLARGVALFVDYKEMKPMSGALGPLETGLPAKPPLRIGGFLVSAGIRLYLN